MDVKSRKKPAARALMPTDHNQRLTALARQEVLASAFQALGQTLHAERETDPHLMTETVLTALASIRTWLEASTVRTSMQGVQRDRLEEWEDELMQASDYLERLAGIVHGELRMSLRDRNRRVVELV